MIHLHHPQLSKTIKLTRKNLQTITTTNGSPIKALKDALACSRLRESRVREMHERENANTKNKREETATGPLSKDHALIFSRALHVRVIPTT